MGGACQPTWREKITKFGNMHAPIALEHAIQPKTRDNDTRALLNAGEESVRAHAQMAIRGNKTLASNTNPCWKTQPKNGRLPELVFW